jgi:hypothetical protein
MIPHMEDRRPLPTPEECAEFFEYLDTTFRHVRARPEPPPPEPPPKLMLEEIQQRLNELFAGTPPRPRPTASPRRPDPSTPEELQQRLDEAFGRVRPAGGFTTPSPKPPPEPPRKLTPEELQHELNEAFAPWEWMKSHPSAGRPPRRLRSFRVGNPATGGPSRRQRCDARVKNLFRIGKNGVRVTRGPFCKGWAMENGRCWVHGGASTGPRTPDGKARVVAAMVEGRRKWVARRRAEGKKFPAGRKRGERWVTEPMRERARSEAHRLKGGRFTLDRPLTLALLRSTAGCLESSARARAMLDVQELAAIERDRQEALGRIRELRSSLLADHGDSDGCSRIHLESSGASRRNA